MISLANIWTVAAAELQLTRRLARYWVFVGLAYVVAGAFFMLISVLHGLFSSYSAMVSIVGPRYMFVPIGLYYLCVFSIGAVFLAFELRARDLREGIHEVLDSKPLTNLELVLGRFAGLFLAAWIPILVLTALLQGLGLLLVATDASFGSPVGMASLFTFAVFLSVPALAFSLAVVFLIALLVRNRLVAALISLVVLIGMTRAVLSGGLLAPLFDYLGMTQIATSSDITPAVAVSYEAWLQRLGILVICAGMLVAAAAVHARLDDGNRWRQAAAAAFILFAGLAMTVGAKLLDSDQIDQRQRWQFAHAEHAAQARADLLSITGSVSIVPGDSLAAQLGIQLRATQGATLDHVLLTLNPGLLLREVKTSSGQTLAATQADGLVDITLPGVLAGDATTTLHLSFSGRPDMSFGYLDSALDLQKPGSAEGGVAMLGYRNGLFERDYVALLPAIHWLPTTGAAVKTDDTRATPRDFFSVDLQVELPDRWLAAGPGRRQHIDTRPPDGRPVHFRFASKAPIPEVALIAAPFESFSVNIEGVTFEALVHPKHKGNFELLGQLGDTIAAGIRERLLDLAQAGLRYPFDALTLVEVPASLRIFEGGWRMNSVAPPAMLLMRETGLPTARFDIAFRQPALMDLGDHERQVQARRQRLEEFFANDFAGGNVFMNASRSFYAQQTSATGPAAPALNFVLDELATLVVSGRRGYFSARAFQSGVNQRIGGILAAYANRQQRDLSFADVAMESLVSRPEVWDHALSASLAELDPAQDSQQAVDLLSLKGGAIAQAIYDQLGRDGAARLLGSLLAAHRGASFTVEDFKQALQEHASPEFLVAFNDLMYGTQLPGFVAEDVQLYRLNDDAGGNPRYQLLVRVRNDEPARGSVRIAWTEVIDRSRKSPAAENLRRVSSELISMAGQSAVQFGVVLPHPPVAVFIDPSLSLNRTSFLAEFQRRKEYPEPHDAIAPVEGVSSMPWNGQKNSGVVLDDLDAGFSIVGTGSGGGMRLGQAGTASGATDQGLPIAGITPPLRWSRHEEISAWGRYRHTVALQIAGHGSSQAAFTGVIPHAGPWKLEVHLPRLPSLDDISTWGTWTLRVRARGRDEVVTYAAGSGTTGWNLVQELDLAEGEVTVLLSDQTSGRLVVADAIRFLPANESVARRTADPDPHEHTVQQVD